MSVWQKNLKRLCCLTLLIAGLAACGQGGTEIGNPNLPSDGQAPASADGDPAAAPSLEGASPTPSPQSFLIEDSQNGEEDLEEEGALIEPEET